MFAEKSTGSVDSARARACHVMVLHQHYWPEIAATAQILSDVCEDLARRGHRVTVICGQPSYRTTGSARLPDVETHAGVEVRRMPVYVPAKRSIPQRLVQYGSYFAGSLAASLRQERPDVCLVMSTPPLMLGVSALLLRALKGVPFVYSVQDLYPDIAVHLGVLNQDGPVTRAASWVASETYSAADTLITLSSGMAERLNQHGAARERIVVVPNWADTSCVRPVPRDNQFAREHGLADRFVVQYSGNLGLSQGLEMLPMVAEALQHLPVRFALVGDGNAKESLLREVERRRLKNIQFLPPQPRAYLGELLGSCDVGLVTMKRGVGHDLVPSKLYGIMAAARPVLAAVESTSEVARVLAAHQCGWSVEPENLTALVDAIKHAMERPDLTELGQRGRTACLTHYSREASTAKYAEALERAARTKVHR